MTAHIYIERREITSIQLSREEHTVVVDITQELINQRNVNPSRVICTHDIVKIEFQFISDNIERFDSLRISAEKCTSLRIRLSLQIYDMIFHIDVSLLAFRSFCIRPEFSRDSRILLLVVVAPSLIADTFERVEWFLIRRH